jgi:hypothetical protein
MQPKKVIILRHQHTPGATGEFELRHICGAGEADLRRCGHVDIAPLQTGRNMGGNVFVKMKADGQRSGRLLEAFLPPFRRERRGVVAAEFFRLRALLPHLLLDFVDVIEIVGKRRVNVRKSYRRRVGNDLIGGHVLMLMPHYNVDHSNPMPSYAGLSTANSRRAGDPVFNGPGHDSSIRN